MEYAIKTRNLTRKFGDLVAVNRVNLEIKKGELFGLLGPNGAGKTTLIHMLCTILPPTQGKAKVAGFDVHADPSSVRAAIGIVFQDPSLDNRLTAKENLDFHGRMYGIPKDQREKRISEVLKLVELDKRANELVDNFSGGMKRRLEMARGLMHKPKILFLDEPTLGLDPQTRRNIWDYIQFLNKDEKVTIVITTHYMDEADQLCNNVGIIDRGKIIALGEPEKLKDQLQGDIVSLDVSNPEKYVKILKPNKNVKGVKISGNIMYLTVKNGGRTIPTLIKLFDTHGGDVHSVGLRRPTLDDVFFRYTGRGIREEGAGASVPIDQMRVRARAGMRRWG